MSKHNIPLGALGVLLLLGCSSEEGLVDAGASAQESRRGLVYVGYEHDWADASEASLLTTTAQFVRYSALDQEQVARLLGLPLDPEEDLPALDLCRTYDLSIPPEAEEALVEGSPANVELLEAGDLQIQAQEKTISLMPRHFPGLLPFISGVIYGESQLTMDKQPQQISASSSGGEAVGNFYAQLSTPALPRLTSLGNAQPAAQVTVEGGGPLAVRWRSASPAPEDVTYLELRYTQEKQEVALRCRVRDDGAFSIPRAMLAGVEGRATLELTRLRRSSFSAAGLDQGELRLTLRDSAALTLK